MIVPRDTDDTGHTCCAACEQMVLDIFLVDGGMLRIDPDEIEAAACESFGKKRAVKANVGANRNLSGSDFIGDFL